MSREIPKLVEEVLDAARKWLKSVKRHQTDLEQNVLYASAIHVGLVAPPPDSPDMVTTRKRVVAALGELGFNGNLGHPQLDNDLGNAELGAFDALQRLWKVCQLGSGNLVADLSYCVSTLATSVEQWKQDNMAKTVADLSLQFSALAKDGEQAQPTNPKKKNPGPKPRYDSQADDALVERWEQFKGANTGGTLKDFAKDQRKSVREIKAAQARVRSRRIRANKKKQTIYMK